MAKSGEFYTFDEVVRQLKIDQNKLKRLVSEGEISAFREGDVIVRIGEAPIEGLRDLSAVLKGMAPGDTTTVTYTRDGAEATVEVTLAAR